MNSEMGSHANGIGPDVNLNASSDANSHGEPHGERHGEPQPGAREFRALGTFAVGRDGETLELGGRKPRAVLALLLAHRNTVVPTDRILDELWGDDSDGKLNALRVHVSRLRDALDPDRARGEESALQTVDNGYRLDVADECYDVARFEAAANDGRSMLASNPGRAADILREALDGWTGGAFAEFADEEFAQSEIRRLTELRIDALEDRIEADLATGLDGELVSELEQLRQQHPLRERLVRHQALALYRSGRPAEGLRAIDRFRRYIGEELGIDPSPRLLRLEEQMLLHDERIQPDLPDEERLSGPKRVATNPFKGLRAFGADDAAAFFGRDALVAELLRTIGRRQRMITLIGASGSGKSSVVRAGLIPALAKGAIDGSDEWMVASMVPGAHPFAELEAALLRGTIDAPASLADQLDDGDAGLLRAALRILPSDDSHLVLVIDQFEELFTLVDDPTVLDRFLANLVTAVDDPHGRVTVVLTLRADFYGLPLAHPAFGARLGSGIVNVTPMTAEELEAAALRPAEEQGVAFEPALLGQLIGAVGNQPGALPLFQYALTELFDRRVGDTLTAASYRSMGGLDGALQRRASDLFDDLDTEHQEAARQLFLRLTVVSDDDQRTRRRVPAREIATIGVDPAVTQDVIRRFSELRLLSFDADPLTGAPTVEVAHEALLTAWPRLDEWIDEGRDDLRRHARLATALREWQLADRDPAYLLSAARVAEFEQLDTARSISLNDPEREFLAASVRHVVALRDEEDRRRAEEHRARRRLQMLAGALALSLGVAALFLFGVVGRGDGPTVTFFGNRSDGSWNASLAAGLDRAARDRDMTVVEVPWVVNPGIEFRELLDTGPEVVVSDRSGYAQNPTVVADHPEITFGFVEADVNAPNATSITFANEEGAFLAGAAAALHTQTGRVGFIGGQRIAVIDEFRAGFEAGVAAVDADVEVVAVFVDQFGGINGFARPDRAAARAHALFGRGVDVVFAAAGHSGFGMFEAAYDHAQTTGEHVWAIGVDNDQWFDVPAVHRPHVLTSVIKRGDVAMHRLVDHILDDGPSGPIGRLGLADEAFAYAESGDGLDRATIDALDHFVEELASGRIAVPTEPTGDVLLVDDDGNAIDGPEDLPDPVPEIGADGLAVGERLDPGTYALEALGTPIELTIATGWATARNQRGDTAFIRLTTPDYGDEMVVFIRPHVLADPTDPGGIGPAMPVIDIERWLDTVTAVEPAERGRREIGGRTAVYFEAEVTDPSVCGLNGFCVGFIGNTIDADSISGWAFEPGFRSRVWWIDQGDEAPLVVIAATRANDLDDERFADELLATLSIGEPAPHPIPFEESGF